MSGSSDSLQPLAKADIQIGEPLQFPVFDQQGQLLMARGQIIETQQQYDALALKGLYQNPRWQNETPRDTQMVKDGSLGAAVKTKRPPKVKEDPTETGQLVRMNMPGDAETFEVKLIGALPDNYLVMTAPVRDGAYVFVKEGQSWEFRSFYGMAVYRFSANVEKVAFSPFPFLVISWPNTSQIERRQIRKARRVLTDIPVALYPDGVASDNMQTGVITNMSTGGVEVRLSSRQVEKSSSLLIAFQLTVGREKVLIEAKVNVMSHNVDDNGTRLGMAFIELPQMPYICIHAFVHDRLVHRLETPIYAGT